MHRLSSFHLLSPQLSKNATFPTLLGQSQLDGHMNMLVQVNACVRDGVIKCKFESESDSDSESQCECEFEFEFEYKREWVCMCAIVLNRVFIRIILS
ncbi:unnamed protein product [Protopolystoma xenopodis]|uniref:Uncharacterized protein n=1 Tax=Protopolystoma xenopodis TaxID=117903 RepID=A0A448WL35_9PLAT|nr:unnamed protein product [Protopolystoma xenopodis]